MNMKAYKIVFNLGERKMPKYTFSFVWRGMEDGGRGVVCYGHVWTIFRSPLLFTKWFLGLTGLVTSSFSC